MRRLYMFLLENPVLLVIALAWIAGMIGNVRKAMQTARERTAQRTAGGQQAPIGEPAPVAEPARPLPARSAEEIAREMRRILGVESNGDRSTHGEPVQGDGGAGQAPARAQPKPPQLPRSEAERHRSWDRPTPERAPTPVAVGQKPRRLPNHVEPHVGEAMARRTNLQPRRTAAAGRAELGDLGGRVHHDTTARAIGGRYALTDLKRIIVLNEILGPPLALRRGDREL
ncbi:MAG: hypothetical protein MUC36_22775 [Planctomycetes bacterium]|nr:hypothetical protein [Planctomycetota bacterium]